MIAIRTSATGVALKNFQKTFSLFRELSKSGIVTLVLISVLGGYLIGQPFERPFDGWRMLLTLVGVMGLASGSSALNQIQDRVLDAKMPRTAGRPLPSGRISLSGAWVFSLSAITVGLAALFFVGPVVLILGLIAIFSYNGLYTLWWKPKNPFGAVPGAIPGALPILMGYVAAHRSISDPGGWYLFAILFFWQMPHFWSLAMKFREDYALGGIPTLPVVASAEVTRKHIALWTLAYVGLAMIAPLFLGVMWLYWIGAAATSVALLVELYRYLENRTPKAWLRFFLVVNFSLIVLLGAAVLDLWSVYWKSL